MLAESPNHPPYRSIVNPVSGMMLGTGPGNVVENKGFIPQQKPTISHRDSLQTWVPIKSDEELAFEMEYHRLMMRILKPATGAALIALGLTLYTNLVG